MTFGGAAALARFGRRVRPRFARRRRHAGVPEPAAGPAWRAAARETVPPGAPDAESVLVALLLSGRLSRRGYQQQMARLAAEDSARGARP